MSTDWNDPDLGWKCPKCQHYSVNHEGERSSAVKCYFPGCDFVGSAFDMENDED